MFKSILISGLLCAFLYAESFDSFLQKAIKNSPYLDSSALAVDQAKEQGSILTRYSNPSLELEYSDIDPNAGSKDSGYRVNYTQPIRLWSVGDDQKALASKMVKSANASYSQQRAIFIRDLSLRFTLYSQQKRLLSLGDEELEIAKKIYDISKARYEGGTISRGLMLQAKVDYEAIQIKNEALVLASSQSYYNLLKFAGINKEITLDPDYSFSVDKATKLKNPNIELLRTQQDKALSEAKVNSNKVQWMNVYAEYETDSGQDVARVGLNFPLAIFNTKSQERKIAMLQASRSELLIDNESKRLDMEIKRLQDERTSLQGQEKKNEQVLTTEIELLKMFQDGYKIASINLLQLQDIKNRLISTKRDLIQIKTALDQNAINLNYNKGTYNE